jgi:sugar phosphate isomerase/epimerase
MWRGRGAVAVRYPVSQAIVLLAAENWHRQKPLPQSLKVDHDDTHEMAIRTGFSTLGDQPLETAFERAAADGFDFVEVTMEDFPAQELAADSQSIREAAETNDVNLVVHLPFRNGESAIGSSDDAVRERALEALTDCVRAAGSVGAEKAVLHVETEGGPHVLAGRDWDPLVAALDELTAAGDDHGVEICAENMTQRLPRLEELAELLDRTDISLTVDTGHARTNGRPDRSTARFLEEHAERVSHIHLNDTRGPVDEHLPFGAGTVDFERILGALPADWEGTLTLEINTTNYAYVAFSRQQLDAVLDRGRS